MTRPHLLYGWGLSLYSGKVRAYLRHKRIAFREKRVTLWDMREIRRRTGANVMPVVVTPQDEWLQDTSHIIDVLETRFADQPVVPETPRQRVAACLLEAWGDEFWLPSAMHYRWHFDENYRAVFAPEGGDNLLPFAPRFLKNRVVARAAGAMRGFLPVLGVVPAQTDSIERWTVSMCDALDAHFARHPYLFGTRASLGDYGLIGPLYAHLGRDPVPARTLIAPRRHLADWVRRMCDPPADARGGFLPDDEVPATLAPLFASVFGEFWPYLRGTLDEVQKATPDLAPGRGYARALGRVRTTLAGSDFGLSARPYSLWMAQRVLDAYRGLDDAGRAAVDEWLAAVGAADVMRLPVPRLRRMALRVAPE
ncbi:MAG: glutathione S-transferase family protein [Sinimarinibacterium flocculans]|uniref:glutathione S-transferase family protein n=1 Tax=Sinimarinibacterium flocculans TaxID=985250 RepID=UPI003C4E79B0